MLDPSRPHRPLRAGEWTHAKAVTFIVTLAASRSVTFAADRAGISRKSAYALKCRDPLFGAAWKAALAASASGRRQGDKVGEVYTSRLRRAQGDKSTPTKDLASARNRSGMGFESLWNMIIESASSSLARQASLP